MKFLSPEVALYLYKSIIVCVCVCVCVCVVCVWLTEQNNKCNAWDQTSDVEMINDEMILC